MEIDIKYDIILERLERSGFQAYLVGGCVRDSLMGRPVHDHDITTSALPEQVIEIFSDCTVVPTGLKHGTVTVLLEGEPFEITTFRLDGDYSDSRRPDSVCFTPSLEEDLSRRDFTVNAIARNIHGQLCDPFGGADDIRRSIIRCVGDPEKRFSEDALRILRAVRFASQLGFTIEENTASAIHTMKDRLSRISRERIREELDKLICGKDCVQVMLEYSDVITEVIPELAPSVGFEQCSPYHKYTVWEHIVRAVGAAPQDDLLLRRTMLYHDIAKPACARFDSGGRGHFKRHAQVGAEMTEQVMKRLRYDNRSISDVTTLIYHHSDSFITSYDMKKLISDIGSELFFKLIKVKKYDNLAKNEFVLDENLFFDQLAEQAREFLVAGECCSLSQLAVKGGDMASLGLSGAEIGSALTELLDCVMRGAVENRRESLMKYAKQRWK